jgi:hypothetical protein
MLQAICLVGGFSATNYLFSRLDEHFSVRDISVMRPDEYLYVICLKTPFSTSTISLSCSSLSCSDNAVVEGAVCCYLDEVLRCNKPEFRRHWY